MDRLRRIALRSLAAVPLLGALPASAAPAGGGPVNVLGVGACGGRLVRRLAAEGRGVADGDFVAVDDSGDARPVELLGGADGPRAGRPLVVVAGAGGPTAGEHAWRQATEWRATRHPDVVPVLILGFRFEGNYRARGIALAGRFAERFGNVSLIDNQSIDDYFLADFEEIPLLELWDRINDHALVQIERVIATSRNA